MTNLYLLSCVLSYCSCSFQLIFLIFIDKLHGSASLVCNQLTSCVLSFSDKINNLIAPLQNMINNPKLPVAAWWMNSIYWFFFLVLPFMQNNRQVSQMYSRWLGVQGLHDIYPLFPFINYQLFSMFIVLNLSTKFLTSGYHFMQETTAIFYRLTWNFCHNTTKVVKNRLCGTVSSVQLQVL